MHLKFLLVSVLVCGVLACDIDLPCKKCLEKKCFFIVSKSHKSYCVSELKNVVDVKQVVRTAKVCFVSDELIKSKFLIFTFYLNKSLLEKVII